MIYVTSYLINHVIILFHLNCPAKKSNKRIHTDFCTLCAGITVCFFVDFLFVLLAVCVQCAPGGHGRSCVEFRRGENREWLPH